MKSDRFKRIIYIIVALSLTIFLDQFTKFLVRHYVQFYERYLFLHDHFYITHVENSGAFLGAGDTLTGNLRTILLNLLPLVAVLYGLWFIFAKKDLNRTTLLAVILVVGGGLGNVYDRIVHGTVTDFLFIDFVIFHTGIFNVADMCIMAGLFIILIQSFMKKKNEPIEDDNTAETSS
jgi:signal peptidase II